MVNLVNPEDVERIVGVPRHPSKHYGRAVSAEHMVYILHSQECRDSGIDLRECQFSLALDQGLTSQWWEGNEDKPVELKISPGGWLDLLK